MVPKVSDFPVAVAASFLLGGSGNTVPYWKMSGHVSLAAPPGCRMESGTSAVLASRGCICPVGQLQERRLVLAEPLRTAENTARGPETGSFRWAALGQAHACMLYPF